MRRLLCTSLVIAMTLSSGAADAKVSRERCQKPEGGKLVKANARHVVYSKMSRGERGLVRYWACNRATGSRTTLTSGEQPTYGDHVTNSSFRLSQGRIAYLVTRAEGREAVRLTIRSFNLRTKRQVGPIEVGRAITVFQPPSFRVTDIVLAPSGAIAWRDSGRSSGRADDATPPQDRVGVRDASGQKFVQIAPQGTVSDLARRGDRLTWQVSGQTRSYDLR